MELDLQAVAAGAASDAGGLDPALLGDFLPTVIEAAGSGRRLRRRELERYGERGAAAASAGVPLRALVDLYLSASWRLWEALPLPGDAGQVKAAGLAVLRAADDGVAALCGGFQLARNDLARRLEAERREVFEALLAGGLRAAGVLGRAADLGLDLASP
ncbi:MAG: transcriptional regulator, CdaR, partial [Frankiales bacterium]|nr:transcriptional regulator, CdaR [Frankiales bacterium]